MSNPLRWIFIVAAICVVVPAFAGEARDWESYGGPVTMNAKKARSVAKVTKVTPADGPEILATGTVAEVCQAKGCWMTVRDGDKDLRVEFKDYGFFVPWDSEGKAVRLQGVVQQRELSEEERAHYAAESKSGKKLPASTLVFVASGVQIEGGNPISEAQRAKIEGKKVDGAKAAPGHDGHAH
jgi:Domain of unknown function (DUF4920)